MNVCMMCPLKGGDHSFSQSISHVLSNLNLCHVVVQSSVVDELQYDPEAFGGLVQLVHAHDVSMANPLHDLDLICSKERLGE